MRLRSILLPVTVFLISTNTFAQEESSEKAVQDTTKPEYWLGLSVQIEDSYTKIEYLTQAIKIDPENEDALYRRGIAYDNIEDHENAVKDFTTALKYASKDPYVYNARAISYKNMEKYKPAVKDLTKGIELAKKDKVKAALYLNRAQIHKLLNNNDKALSDFKKVKALVMGGPMFMNAITEINKLEKETE